MSGTKTVGTAERNELLGHGGPREILARIVTGDPLEIRHRTARRARERALLVDVERASLRAFALVAARGTRYRGRPRLELWLDARVDDALDEWLEEERAASCAHAPGAPSRRGGAQGGELARRLGLSPRRLAAGRARFHELGFDDRDAFLRLVIEVAPLDATANALGVTVTELARRARRALQAFLVEVA